MGTRYRALAAPVDVSTGDQRRFAEGAISADALPLPLRIAREDVGAHDGAVVVGRIDALEITPGEIWADITMFDDVDPARMPRLAEDVAEAMTLMDAGVIGLSVDLDDFEVEVVPKGGDAGRSAEEIIDDPEADVELLVTKGRIRSATLVAIPAFAETKGNFEQLAAVEDDEAVSEPEDEEAEDAPELASGEGAAAREREEEYALVASALTETLYDATAFTPPAEITGPTPITYDLDRGIVYGHVAPWGTCHVGIPDACVMAPRDPAGGEYPEFHVHRVPTTEGLVYAGRITAGGNHPSSLDDTLTAHSVRRLHDEKTTVAYVRAKEDDYGIFVCGPLVNDDLDEDTRRTLSRRKVSADWRETQDGLSMIEVLALGPGNSALSEPGFPVRAAFQSGRQVALTAAMSPEPVVDEAAVGRMFGATLERLVSDRVAAEFANLGQAAALRNELAGAMSEADKETAERLRVELAGMIGA